MADRDSRRYYWLKLEKDFFKRHDIRIIEGMPNGKDYIIFYLKLLCESTSHEGYLRFSETIPYNEDMLATITNTNVDIVRSAIKIFTELQMMQILDDGTYYLKQVEKMIGSETGQTIRKREARELKRYELGNSAVNLTLDIEKEKDIELEKDIDIEKDISNIDACVCEEEIHIETLKQLQEMIEANIYCKPLSTMSSFKLKCWVEDYGLDMNSIYRDLLEYQKRPDIKDPMNYMSKCLEKIKNPQPYKQPQQEETRDDENYRYVGDKKIVRKSKWLDEHFGKEE